MGRTYAIAYIDENAEGGPELVLRTPWDETTLVENISNCDASKKSVTLINGDIVRDISVRGQTIDFYTNLGPWRVQLRGGVNVYISKPDGAGKNNSDVQKLSAAERKEAAEEAAKWTVLHTALLTPDGHIFKKQGDRIMTEVFADLWRSGFRYMPETPETIPDPVSE